MTIGDRVSRKFGRILRWAGDGLVAHSDIEGTWIDVGAHHGETTLRQAALNPGLKVYAFEPNLTAAAKLIGRASNYLVIPMAVAEKDGLANLHINSFDAASSLLPFNEASLQNWIGGEALKVNSTVPVPTIRLDTFMNLAKIEDVGYLKIDTQGADLAVVKSAGERLRDIAKITLEVDVTPVPLYEGAPTKDEIISYLKDVGFSLVTVEKQSHGQEENLTFIRNDLASRLRDGESVISGRLKPSK
jgi:FkbM family methyltransferase